jgi:hypothetical protein
MKSGDPITMDRSSIADYIARCSKVLEENNVRESRDIILPAWMVFYLDVIFPLQDHFDQFSCDRGDA